MMNVNENMQADSAAGPGYWTDFDWAELYTVRVVAPGGTFSCEVTRIDDELFERLDWERRGALSAAALAELDSLDDKVVVDWSEEFDVDGLRFKDLRGAVRNPVTKEWTLRDGRVVQFFQLAPM